ncbi:Hydrolase, alpha/beta fold family [Alloalcanivorax dieselolei B5]|uniref:Hydrolase, alpha/beta fold family n=1 Tax=Alcanivorax dieselolei (strain DSM 16502 / CGMCC 1.3690 / MCCC 1A00001 / B-5) TaxID=930169 RepID=K0CB91_ALCDB|nr:alpha/beta hydrolase [Alloalcanivorax dieselolei]AFT68972.1 Hydrolase, alpha/beta fold family [Alloalcanivorax dieselolei B5]
MSSGIIKSNGMELYYDARGPEDGEPILFIMGLSAQWVFWPEALLDDLARRGYRVIAFDNRDAGMSTAIRAPIRQGPVGAMARYMLGMPVAAPYTLVDMVADTVGLLDALGIAKAHLVGASMGGMIAQLTAATQVSRVLSLTSIMSSNNSPFLPPPKPAALKTLVAPKVQVETLDQYLAFGRDMMSRIGGTLPQDQEDLERAFRQSWERGLNPRGIRNQFMAILATGSLNRYLRRVRCPAQIIHGGSDPLIRPAGGKASAKAIPGARLAILEGMGHDLPPAVLPRVGELIAATAQRAGASRPLGGEGEHLADVAISVDGHQ